LEATIGGKAMPSSLQHHPPTNPNTEEDFNEEEQCGASIQQRVEICETKLEELEHKAQFIEHIAGLILKGMQIK
jgi:hypothetical protein